MDSNRVALQYRQSLIIRDRQNRTRRVTTNAWQAKDRAKALGKFPFKVTDNRLCGLVKKSCPTIVTETFPKR